MKSGKMASTELDQLLDEIGETLVVSKSTTEGNMKSRSRSSSLTQRSNTFDVTNGSRYGVQGAKLYEQKMRSSIEEKMSNTQSRRSSSIGQKTMYDDTKLDSLLYDLNNALKPSHSNGKAEELASSYPTSHSVNGRPPRAENTCAYVSTIQANEVRKETPSYSCHIRCVVPVIGGNVKNQCRNLHCVKCDNRVMIFNGMQWQETTEESPQSKNGSEGVTYLFLRNVYPSREKLMTKMMINRNCTAYACQCSVRRTSKLLFKFKSCILHTECVLLTSE